MTAPGNLPTQPSARLVATPPFRRQAVWLATVGYVVALALSADRGREPGGWLLGTAALGIAFAASRRSGVLVRAAGWGLAVVVASTAARAESRGLDVCGDVGVLACVLCAGAAIARIPWDGGVARAAATSQVLGAALVCALWVPALVAGVVPEHSLDGGPLADVLDNPAACALGAAAASALFLLVAVERERRRRRLELGVQERALAIRAILGTALAAELVALGLARAPAYVTARTALALTAVAVVLAASAADAVRVARAARRLVVLAIVGGGVALLGASAASGADLAAWEITLWTAFGALAVGVAARSLEMPLRPSRGVWLDSFVQAGEAAARADPEEAIRGALAVLRHPSGLEAPPIELWMFPPTRCLTVDAAGYLHERPAELPALLVPVALAEPDTTLRTEVLESLEVRRPELRPLAKWMSDEGALLVTVIEGDGETEGVLVLPSGSRAHAEPITLEEVRAFKAVAQRLAAPCRARAALARNLARTQEATRRAEAAEEVADRLRHERALDVGRDGLATTRLARPATVGVYSASSKAALEALERRTAVGAPIAVVAPSGVDPVPYLARAHLAGARRDAPLVLVDATSAREHDGARWSDPQVSPLALADRGMLVLLDGAALPLEIQRLVAGALAQKRAPWERPDPLDVQLALTGVEAPDELVQHARLDATLAMRLGEARSSPVPLPRLRDRADDLRAIVTDRLAREGLRVLGRPVGIEQAAFARLLAHAFPGEDAELAAVVQQLVARCARSGTDVVGAAHVEALRLSPHEGRPRRRKDPLSA